MRVSISFHHMSLHLLCILVLVCLLRWLHWYRWSPLVSKFCLQNGHLSCSVVSQMSIRRQRRRLNRNSRLSCLFSSLWRGRSRSPWPSLPSMISSMLCLLSFGSFENVHFSFFIFDLLSLLFFFPFPFPTPPTNFHIYSGLFSYENPFEWSSGFNPCSEY